MTTPTWTLETLPDGRTFVRYHDGSLLSWSPTLYDTLAEERADYPRMRAVVAAMREHRPDDLAREIREHRATLLGRVFRGSARVMAILEGA